jgi:pentatricopeptide repeat protein
MASAHRKVLDIRHLCSTARLACDKGHARDAINMLDQLHRDRLAPDRFTFDAVVECAAKKNLPHDAARLIDGMSSFPSLGPPDLQNFNMVVHGFAKKNDPAAARLWVNRILAERLKPDSVTYTSLIVGFGNISDYSAVERVFEEMVGNSVSPSAVTFSACISACGKMNLIKIEDAENWIHRMENEFGFSPDTAVYNALLDVCTKAKRVDRVLYWLEHMKAQPDDRSMNALITALARKGDAQAATLWLEKLIVKNKGGCIDHIQDETMKTILNRGIPLAREHFNTVISACGSQGDCAGAEMWLDRLSENSIAPDIVSYTCMLHAFAKIGRTHTHADMKSNGLRIPAVVGAERIWKRMLDADIKPNIRSFSAMIDVCSKAGDALAAAKTLEQMPSQGVLPDLRAFSSVIDAFARLGDGANAVYWFDRMVAANIRPDAKAFTAVIDAFSKAGNMNKAKEWVVRMQNSGVPLDHKAFQAAMRMKVTNQQQARA